MHAPPRVGDHVRGKEAAMGCGTRNKIDLDMLDRIVALLLALAGLAERAAGAPPAARCLALWALRLGDAVARAYVAGLPFGSAARACGPGDAGCTPADALNLALSLRMLAFTLQGIAARLRRRPLPDQPGAPLDSAGWVVWFVHPAAPRRVQRFDTS
jgi:hypothetical protein